MRASQHSLPFTLSPPADDAEDDANDDDNDGELGGTRWGVLTAMCWFVGIDVFLAIEFTLSSFGLAVGRGPANMSGGRKADV